jgi:hypothetical protein
MVHLLQEVEAEEVLLIFQYQQVDLVDLAEEEMVHIRQTQEDQVKEVQQEL